MNAVAKKLEMPKIRVYEVATFYTMFNRCAGCCVLFDVCAGSIAPPSVVAESYEPRSANVYKCLIGLLRAVSVCFVYFLRCRDPIGKYFVQVCTTTPCMVCGAYDMMKRVEENLGIHNGQTTPDGLFTLLEVECLGACSNAPMIQINDYFFEDLTPATTVTLLDDLVAGRPVKIGPQNGRVHALGPQGRTCLKDFEAKPYCRELPAPMDQNPPAA